MTSSCPRKSGLTSDNVDSNFWPRVKNIKYSYFPITICTQCILARTNGICKCFVENAFIFLHHFLQGLYFNRFKVLQFIPKYFKHKLKPKQVFRSDWLSFYFLLPVSIWSWPPGAPLKLNEDNLIFGLWNLDKQHCIMIQPKSSQHPIPLEYAEVDLKFKNKCVSKNSSTLFIKSYQ